MGKDFLTYAYIRAQGLFKAKARNILGDPDEAQDVLQDAFCRLWQSNYSPESESEASRLLSTTVRNVSIDRLRTKKESLPVQENIADDTFDQANREELFKDVDTIIESELTDLQKLILSKKEYQGQSLEDIAKDLGMNAPAVRMQLSRARKIIRECYRRNHQ